MFFNFMVTSITDHARKKGFKLLISIDHLQILHLNVLVAISAIIQFFSYIGHLMSLWDWGKTLVTISTITQLWKIKHLFFEQMQLFEGLLLLQDVFEGFSKVFSDGFSRISLRISLSTFEMNLTESLGFFRSESDKETQLL